MVHPQSYWSSYVSVTSMYSSMGENPTLMPHIVAIPREVQVHLYPRFLSDCLTLTYLSYIDTISTISLLTGNKNGCGLGRASWRTYFYSDWMGLAHVRPTNYVAGRVGLGRKFHKCVTSHVPLYLRSGWVESFINVLLLTSHKPRALVP